MNNLQTTPSCLSWPSWFPVPIRHSQTGSQSIAASRSNNLKTTRDEDAKSDLRRMLWQCWQHCLALLPYLSYSRPVKTLTVRLPDSLVTEIEHESRARRISKADVVRERLRHPQRAANAGGSMRLLIGDLIGSVRNDGLPTDIASNKKKYLPALIRAKKLHRR